MICACQFREQSIQDPIANARDNLARDASRLSQSIVRRNNSVMSSAI